MTDKLSKKKVALCSNMCQSRKLFQFRSERLSKFSVQHACPAGRVHDPESHGNRHALVFVTASKCSQHCYQQLQENCAVSTKDAYLQEEVPSPRPGPRRKNLQTQMHSYLFYQMQEEQTAHFTPPHSNGRSPQELQGGQDIEMLIVMQFTPGLQPGRKGPHKISGPYGKLHV